MATLTRTELTYFKKELENLKQEVIQRYNQSKPRPDEEVNSIDNHMGDAGTALYEQERDLSLRDSDAELLDEINFALKRIEKGTYGKCVDTSKPIAKERLKAIPYAKRTIEAQKEYNQNSREDTGDKTKRHDDPSETIERLKEEQDAFNN